MPKIPLKFVPVCEGFYDLQISIKNDSEKRMSIWHVDVEIQSDILDPESHRLKIDSRSNDKIYLLRFVSEDKGEIFPGDTLDLKIRCKINMGTWAELKHDPTKIVVRLYCDGGVQIQSVSPNDLTRF
jgi:hypothetical protein